MGGHGAVSPLASGKRTGDEWRVAAASTTLSFRINPKKANLLGEKEAEDVRSSRDKNKKGRNVPVAKTQEHTRNNSINGP